MYLCLAKLLEQRMGHTRGRDFQANLFCNSRSISEILATGTGAKSILSGDRHPWSSCWWAFLGPRATVYSCLTRASRYMNKNTKKMKMNEINQIGMMVIKKWFWLYSCHQAYSSWVKATRALGTKMTTRPQSIPYFFARLSRLIDGTLVKRAREARQPTGRLVKLKLQHVTNKVPERKIGQILFSKGSFSNHWELSATGLA